MKNKRQICKRVKVETPWVKIDVESTNWKEVIIIAIVFFSIVALVYLKVN